MSDRSDQIRKWLLRAPRPESVTVLCRDGESHEVNTTGGIRWRDVAETIDALEPVQLQAIRGGKLLRAERFVYEPEPVAPHRPVRDNEAVPIPSALSDDPETARLSLFANLLHRAYQHSTDVAFTRLLELVDRMDQRSENLERRLERTEKNLQREMEERMDDAWSTMIEQAEAAASGDPKENILSSFVQGLAQSQQQPRPNGKGKPS